VPDETDDKSVMGTACCGSALKSAPLNATDESITSFTMNKK
jgi:hypothetical protein